MVSGPLQAKNQLGDMWAEWSCHVALDVVNVLEKKRQDMIRYLHTYFSNKELVVSSS